MAEQKNKKSQADKAVAAAKSNKKTTNKSTSSKTAKETKKEHIREQKHSAYPLRLITSLISLGLFVLFLVISQGTEGALTKVIESLVLGLLGSVGFTVSIPALLYLFIIQAFSGKRPVKMRSICLLLFVFLCGCISHLSLGPHILPEGLAVLGSLYNGGIIGTTGGVLCGCVTMLLHWLCGTALSYIILIIAAILTLLGSMQITIPSIVRAVRNRPRAEWEDKDIEEIQEPAAVVVNHLANKRIEHIESRKNKAAELEISENDVQSADKPGISSKMARATEMMRQISADVHEPVAAAGVMVTDASELEITTSEIAYVSENKAIAKQKKQSESESPIPVAMPAFEINEEIPPAPQVVKPRKVTAKEADESEAQIAREIAKSEAEVKPEYCFPPIALLKHPREGAADGTVEMRENSRRLNETLDSFRIEAHIINVTRGPSVTRYEVELEKGVKLSKLTSAADDIALSLGASGVRIAAVPGKISVVGIEVPNKMVTTVSLREVIDSTEFERAKSKSSFAVGKDIGGTCIVGNIAKLPHMLIAGTTGSGKSVCMNSIIISLLYKASPEDVKLIMIDPKMVELGIYNSIPHLLIPVVTDPKKAAGSLQWL